MTRIKTNPFAGLRAEDARALCGQIMRDTVDGLPTRPALPHEKEDSGLSRIFTERSWSIIETVESDAREALQLAGHDPETTFSNGGAYSVC